MGGTHNAPAVIAFTLRNDDVGGDTYTLSSLLPRGAATAEPFATGA